MANPRAGILLFLHFEFCAFCISFAAMQIHGTDVQVLTILFCRSYLLLCRIHAVSPHARMAMAFMRIISPLISSSATLLAAIIICVRDVFVCVRTLLFIFMFRVSLGLESRDSHSV